MTLPGGKRGGVRAKEQKDLSHDLRHGQLLFSLHFDSVMKSVSCPVKQKESLVL